MNKPLSLVIFFFLLSKVQAQLPETDLWLFKLQTDKQKNLVATKPINITNRKGYDNQPSFSNDGKRIYYSSIKEDKQADIYYYDLKKKKNIQLAYSAESEYSPVQSANGKFITCVVVEKDSSQKIHFLDALNGTFVKKFDFDSVGYYNFLNEDTVLYYKLTAPHSLRFYTTGTGLDRWLGNAPIRGFKTINRHTFIYGLKDSAKVAFYTYDFHLQKAEKYADFPSLQEDILWHPSLGLIKSEGPKLLRFDPVKKEWTDLFDLSGFGIKKITRFIFDASNKYLVVTDNL
jgi:hypothetical protein